MNVLILIATFFGGGVVVWFFDWLRRRGKIYTDDPSLIAQYHHTEDFQNYFTQFNLEIQFINTSGDTKIINQFSAIYFDGQTKHELSFIGHNVPPADVITPNGVKLLRFELYSSSGRLPYPIDKKLYVEVKYILDQKSQSIRIKNTEFTVKDTTPPPFYTG